MMAANPQAHDQMILAPIGVAPQWPNFRIDARVGRLPPQASITIF